MEHPPLSSSPPYATTTLERDSTRLQSRPPPPPPPVLSPTPLVSGLALSEDISCLQKHCSLPLQEKLTVKIEKGTNRSFGLAIAVS